MTTTYNESQMTHRVTAGCVPNIRIYTEVSGIDLYSLAGMYFGEAATHMAQHMPRHNGFRQVSSSENWIHAMDALIRAHAGMRAVIA